MKATRPQWYRMLIAVMLLFPAAARATEKIPVEQFKLGNGMEVIVLPNHRVPAISHMLWFRVGSADDPEGKSGLAHFLEHMMFKGTDAYKAGEFSDIIARHGGDQNAFTSYDSTGYYVNIAKEHLPLVMKLEAARLRGLKLEEGETEKEREVIIEERRQRIENSPEALLDEEVNAALFRHHPYGIPVIGWMHEMQGLNREDVLDFHKKYYHAGNAVLIVSGDITAAELKPLAERSYGTLPKAETPLRNWVSEPPQRAPRQVELRHENVKQEQWLRRYIAPSFGSGKEADVLPAFLLSQVLGGGKTSILYQALVVEQKLASQVDTSYNGIGLGPADFTITVIPEKNVSFEQIENAVDAQLARIKQDGFSAEDIGRAKTLLKAESVYARDGLSSMARIMGWIRMAGKNPDYFVRWQELIDAVQASQMQAVAHSILIPEASVTGHLLPREVTP
ncbi:MAG: M16 family metallopeptidase [Alphaproteobacteria bacterium]